MLVKEVLVFALSMSPPLALPGIFVYIVIDRVGYFRIRAE